METGIDEGFLGRVYRTSAFLWAIGTLVSWNLGGLPAAAGWTVGSALSIGVLRGFEQLANRYFVPGSKYSRRDFARFSAAKLPIILLVLVGLVLIGGRSFEAIAAFCAGVILTQAVIVLKALGILIVRR
ncbi:MAG: hypothetical protein N3B12_01075 [Armatimonadetes bacterium]|nr:hypothetical protein [Armatimonadota bacterium]